MAESTPIPDVQTLGSGDALHDGLGTIARHDIRICYMDWRRDVPPTGIEDAIKCLGDYFEYDYQESLYTPYTRKKLNGAWRTFKSQLYQYYVEDENPSHVKEAVPDDLAIPLEDWQQFVDNCNTDQYKASSIKGQNNRGKKDPKSRAIGVHDALAQETAPDKRVYFRGMCTGVCKSQIRMMDPFLKKNSKLLKINSELENNMSTMNANLEEQKAEMAELRALIMRQGRESTSCSPSPHRDISRENHADENACLGKKCDLRTGLPLRTVANAIVQAIDPHLEFGDRKLEEGNFKVFVTVVHNEDIKLSLPHDEYYATLGQLRQGSIIWPKGALRLKH